MKEFIVKRLISEDYVTENSVISNPTDNLLAVKWTLQNKFPINISVSDNVTPGTLQFGLEQRKFYNVALNSKVTLYENVKEFVFIPIITLSKAKTENEIDLNNIKLPYDRIYIANETLYFYNKTNIEGVVVSFNNNINFGYINETTSIVVAPTTTAEKLCEWGEMNIGGIDDAFQTLMQRAFASRMYKPSLIAKTGTKHLKGVILHGPPGTGKTLLARELCRVLNSRPPKIVNGPELLNKYVGQSEENIRRLFLEAEQEYKTKGDNSELHVIIFDEIDSICKARGNSSSGVGDGVVNQLLTKLDGVDALNNILVIGMTNRLDLIDEALLRPGRFELKLAIALPDEKGRAAIFNIHTREIRANQLFDFEFNPLEFARLACNYTGAEIEAVIRCAVSIALMRGISPDQTKKVVIPPITRNDVLQALDQIIPRYGTKHITKVLFDKIKYPLQNQVCEYIKANEIKQRNAIHICGERASGKSTLVRHLCTIVNPNTFTAIIAADGSDERQRCARINLVFDECERVSHSVVIIDDIERLIDYTSLGPRFSNTILQTLLARMALPSNKHVMVLWTSTIQNFVTNVLDLELLFDKHFLI